MIFQTSIDGQWNFSYSKNPNDWSVSIPALSDVENPNISKRKILSEGLFVIKKDGLFGAVDKKGNLVIPIEYTKLYDSVDGFMAYEKNGIFGLLENPINPPVTKVQTQKNEVNTIDTDNLKTPFKTEEKLFEDTSKNINGKVEKQGEYGYTCGLIPVKMNGMWGYADEKMNIVIPCQYSGAWNFNEESCLAIVMKDRKYYVIDTKGTMILKEASDFVSITIPSAIKVYRYNANGEQIWSYYDQNGKEISEKEYNNIEEKYWNNF